MAEDELPEGLTIYEDGSIYAVGEDAIAYITEHYGYKSCTVEQNMGNLSEASIVRRTSIPTSTMTLLDGTKYTNSYAYLTFNTL